jgi:hypothetical protein
MIKVKITKTVKKPLEDLLWNFQKK